MKIDLLLSHKMAI